MYGYFMYENNTSLRHNERENIGKGTTDVNSNKIAIILNADLL